MIPPSEPYLLGYLAESLLATAYETLVESSNGIPERSMVTYANPVDDCLNALTVYVGAVEGLTATDRQRGNVRQGCAIATQVPFYVRLVRCVTSPSETGVPPSADVQTGEARGLLEDAWRLWHGIIAAWKLGTLFGDIYSVGCANVTLGPLNAVAASGGAAGWQWKITVQVDEITAATS